MFLTELFPIAQKLLQQPVAFTGGFCSGLFKLNLNEEPLSVWLAKQGYTPSNNNNSGSDSNRDRNGPQSISIE
jgi:hypothetical protein